MEHSTDFRRATYVPEYALQVGYSTNYDSGNNRTTATQQAHSQDPLQNLFVDVSQAFTGSHFHQLDGLTEGQLHNLAGDGTNFLDIRHYSRSANEAPWSGFTGHYLQNDAQLFQSRPYLSKARTITEGLVSPSNIRPSFGPIQDSTMDSHDSTFDSIQSASLESISQVDRAYPLNQSSDRYVSPIAPKSVRSESRLPIHGNVAKRKRTKPPLAPCSACGKELKNQSDAKKHTYQHSKPWRCRQPNCPRRDGFATKNDLERHRKGVHGQRPSVGKKTGYICSGCIQANPDEPRKWWPRLDNFKAHVDRKHPQLNRDHVVEISEAPKPSDVESESGYASQALPSVVSGETGQDEMQQPSDVGAARRVSQSSEFPVFNLGPLSFDPLAGVGEGPSDESSHVSDHQRAVSRTQIDSEREPSLPNDARFQLGSPIRPIPSPLLGDSRNGLEMHVPHIAQHLGTSEGHLFERTNPSFLGLSSGFPPKSRLPAGSHDLSMYRVATGEFRCPYCNKIKRRECDLRKHLKRHTRPYGCTFPDCYQAFGSRNDWKRHENSQHTLNDMWRCEVPVCQSYKCGKLFNSEEEFKTHLEHKHGVPPKSPELARCAKEMHLGREGYHRFWCGFCQCLINPEGDASRDKAYRSAWLIRFRHIGDHFDKGSHIVNWVCIKYNKPVSVLIPERKKKARPRFKDDPGNDDSDLGDDGIPFPVSYSSYLPSPYDPTTIDLMSKRRGIPGNVLNSSAMSH